MKTNLWSLHKSDKDTSDAGEGLSFVQFYHKLTLSTVVHVLQQHVYTQVLYLKFNLNVSGVIKIQYHKTRCAIMTQHINTQSYYDIVYNNNLLSMSSIYPLWSFLSTNLKHHLKVVRADNGSHLQNVKSFRIVGPRLRAASVCVVLRFRSCIRSCHSLYHWSWSSEIKLPGNLKLRDQIKLLEPPSFWPFPGQKYFQL